MKHDDVMAWVTGYEVAWRASNAAAVKELFTEDARYRPSPYKPAKVGHGAIQEFWRDDEGTPFQVRAEVVAFDGHRAVVRVDVDYLGSPPEQYLNLWVMDFDEDGRVREFEEWTQAPYAGETDPP